MAAFVPALSLTASPALSRSAICGARLARSAAPVRATVTMADSDSEKKSQPKMKMSPSMPFLPKPKNLSEDMAGYTGFDPLGLSELFDIKWLQQSEIKHGRIAMLAFVGIIVQEFVHLPGPQFQNPLATEAVYQVPTAGLWQIFLFCGLCEFVLHRGRMSTTDMFNDGAVPGELGFNPMNLKMTDDIRLKEIKNGRLAMCGTGGVIHSMLLFKTPVIAQLANFKPIPVNL